MNVQYKMEELKKVIVDQLDILYKESYDEKLAIVTLYNKINDIVVNHSFNNGIVCDSCKLTYNCGLGPIHGDDFSKGNNNTLRYVCNDCKAHS